MYKTSIETGLYEDMYIERRGVQSITLYTYPVIGPFVQKTSIETGLFVQARLYK